MPDLVVTMAAPFLACVALAGIHAHFGIHVLSRRVVFVDLALAQLVAVGAVVAALAGAEPGSWAAHACALGCGIAGAALLTLLPDHDDRIPREALVGVIYAAASALTILLSVDLAHGLDHVRELMSGSILWLDGGDVAFAAGVYLAVVAVHVAFRRLLVRKPRTRLGEFVFYSTFAVVVTSSVHLAGVFLVFAYLVVPAAISRTLADRYAARIAIGWATGVVASTLGVVISYEADLPSGPVIVVVLAAILAVVLVVQRARSGVAGGQDRGMPAPKQTARSAR